MNYFGKMKEYASKATNLADKFLNEGAASTPDEASEINFLKDKVSKL